MRFALFLLIAAPVIAGEFATNIGDAYPHSISAITTDSTGNTYVVGTRTITSSVDAFLSKLDPNGNVLFTKTFGGNGTSLGSAIAVDPAGNIYIAGTTQASDFPVSSALQSQPGASTSGFIVKLSGDGSAILYSTYFGGTEGSSTVSSIATDANGNLYILGDTSSTDFQQTSGLPNIAIQNGGTMIAKVSPAGDKIVYAGAFSQAGQLLAVDAAGDAFIADVDNGSALPNNAGGIAPNGMGAFVSKINAGGTGFGYQTYLAFGGILINAIAVDAAGDAYVGGGTVNPAFPTTPGSLQPAYGTPQGGTTVGFLVKINPTGSAVLWGTYLGGIAANEVADISIDASGNVWATGSAFSTTFPNANGWSNGPDYLAGVSADGSKMIYSALFPLGTVAKAVAADPLGFIHTAGMLAFVSAVNPTAAPAMKIFDFENPFGGNVTAQLAPAEIIAIYGPGIGPATPVVGAPVNGFYPTTLGGVQVSINGSNIPLLYVSANQINAVVPMNLAPNATATVQVVNGTATSAGFPVWILPASPLAYQTVVNQDGTINSLSNPAPGGSIVTFYATGWQPNFPSLADGQIAATATDVCLGKCTALASYAPPIMCEGFCFARPKTLPGEIDVPATVLYAGDSPGSIAGLTQFNIQVGTPMAGMGFTLSVSGPPSNPTAGLGVPIFIAP